MALAAKGGYKGIPQAVGREFIKADKGKHFEAKPQKKGAKPQKGTK